MIQYLDISGNPISTLAFSDCMESLSILIMKQMERVCALICSSVFTSVRWCKHLCVANYAAAKLHPASETELIDLLGRIPQPGIPRIISSESVLAFGGFKCIRDGDWKSWRTKHRNFARVLVYKHETEVNHGHWFLWLEGMSDISTLLCDERSLNLRNIFPLLDTLCLDNNLISSISPLSACPSLRELYLRSNAISGEKQTRSRLCWKHLKNMVFFQLRPSCTTLLPAPN
jgi:Leucine-rich repeat (LRR) protein